MLNRKGNHAPAVPGVGAGAGRSRIGLGLAALYAEVQRSRTLGHRLECRGRFFLAFV